MPRRPDPSKLPKNLRPRDNADGSVTYVSRYKDPNTGKWRDKRVGKDQRRAKKRHRELSRGTPEEETKPSIVARPLSPVAEQYLESRRRSRRAPKTLAEIRGRIHNYVLPHFGDRLLSTISTRDLYGWLDGLYDLQRPGGGRLSEKTIQNVFMDFRVMLKRVAEDARGNEEIWVSPFEGFSEEKIPQPIPQPRDPFTRNEVLALTTDPRIDLHNRVFWSLLSYTGMRHGEAAGLRWRDLDLTCEPLGKITLAGQGADKSSLKEGEGVTKEIPIHPTLATVLSEWRRLGFSALRGHHPQPDDFIVPNTVGTMRRRDTSGKQLKLDCATVGSEVRVQHCFRHAFISEASEKGSIDHLRRITHKTRGRDAFDRYYRKSHWLGMCTAVATLDYGTVEYAQVMTLDQAVGDPTDVAENVAPTITASHPTAIIGQSGGRTGDRTLDLGRVKAPLYH